MALTRFQSLAHLCLEHLLVLALHQLGILPWNRCSLPPFGGSVLPYLADYVVHFFHHTYLNRLLLKTLWLNHIPTPLNQLLLKVPLPRNFLCLFYCFIEIFKRLRVFRCIGEQYPRTRSGPMFWRHVLGLWHHKYDTTSDNKKTHNEQVKVDKYFIFLVRSLSLFSAILPSWPIWKQWVLKVIKLCPRIVQIHEKVLTQYESFNNK